MSILDWFLDDPEQDPTDKILMNGLKRFGQYEGMRALAVHALPDEDRDLRRTEARLDIRTKKRALGLPEDSDDLDESRNSNAPFWTVTARHALQRIPEAGFMSGKSPLSPFLKTARSITHEPNSIGFAGRIARALR